MYVVLYNKYTAIPFFSEEETTGMQKKNFCTYMLEILMKEILFFFSHFFHNNNMRSFVATKKKEQRYFSLLLYRLSYISELCIADEVFRSPCLQIDCVTSLAARKFHPIHVKLYKKENHI
jgi:hypothetical protein